MLVVTTIADLRDATADARARDHTVGLVPTMGYLHDGHASLMRASAAERDLTVVTVFVNPLQFAAGEDLGSYPRDPEGDRAVAQEAGVDVFFLPGDGEMYPDELLTTVTVDRLSAGLEGGSRPTHFAGVATVVTKLFAIVGPCRAYFGEKDYQQLLVVRALAADLSLGVEVVGCPTHREPDGLAMSSRNAYLSAGERAAAPVLHRALLAGRDLVSAGERDPRAVESAMASVVAAEPAADLDYAVVRDPDTLAELSTIERSVRLLVAARFPSARLLDNLAAERA